MRCIQCQSQAETTAPYPLCQAHAVEYYKGLLTFVEGRRIARNPPHVVKARAELENIRTLRNFLAARKGVNRSRWPWTRVKME